MAKDLIHFKVRKSLEKDGWSIIADPFRLPIDGVKLEIDLQAETIVQWIK